MLRSALLVTIFLGATTSFAKTPSLWLSWTTPADRGCLSQETVLEEARRLRGGFEVAANAALADVSVTVKVVEPKPDSPRWVAEVDTVSSRSSGHRRLEADSCQHASEVLVVVLSLALDDPEEAVAGVMAVPPPVAIPEPAPPMSTVEFTAAPIATLHAGLWPRVQFAAGAALGVKWKRLRLELGATSAVPQPGVAGEFVELSTPVLGELGLCFIALEGRVELEGCLGFAAARLEGRRLLNNPTNQIGVAPWAAVWLGGNVRVRLWRIIWARLGGNVGGAVIAPRLLFNDSIVYQVPVVTGRLSLGFEVRF